MLTCYALNIYIVEQNLTCEKTCFYLIKAEAQVSQSLLYTLSTVYLKHLLSPMSKRFVPLIEI